RPVENSICLIAIGSNRFEKTIDHEIVFKRHAQLAGDSAFDHSFFYHAQHERLGNPRASIFFNYAESDQAPLSNAILVEQQFEQTNWKPKSCQPAVQIAQDHIDVRHSQREPDRFIPVLGDPCKLRQEQRLKFFGHKFNLRFCEWHKAPVLFPCLVVNFAEPSAFIPKIFEIRWTKSDSQMRGNASSEPSQLRHGF